MARKGKTGHTTLLNINENQGNLIQWDLPVYMELKGLLDDKSLTQKLQGTFAYQYQNTTLGLSKLTPTLQAYQALTTFI